MEDLQPSVQVCQPLRRRHSNETYSPLRETVTTAVGPSSPRFFPKQDTGNSYSNRQVQYGCSLWKRGRGGGQHASTADQRHTTSPSTHTHTARRRLLYLQGCSIHIQGRVGLAAAHKRHPSYSCCICWPANHSASCSPCLGIMQFQHG